MYKTYIIDMNQAANDYNDMHLAASFFASSPLLSPSIFLLSSFSLPPPHFWNNLSLLSPLLELE